MCTTSYVLKSDMSSTFAVEATVRGYRVYHTIWDSTVGEEKSQHTVLPTRRAFAIMHVCHMRMRRPNPSLHPYITRIYFREKHENLYPRIIRAIR